jgi:hypothetical protein
MSEPTMGEMLSHFFRTLGAAIMETRGARSPAVRRMCRRNRRRQLLRNARQRMLATRREHRARRTGAAKVIDLRTRAR